jgi:deazaflavin-dependent oxidoreductase (nitroreductase family)
MYYNMTFNEKSKQRYIRLFKVLNKIVVPLVRIRFLALFGFGHGPLRLLLLTTKGRKSGKKRRNPLEFFRIDGVIHIFSGWGEHASWFKNMVAHPEDVHVQVGFRAFDARVEVLEEESELEVIRWLLKNYPTYSKAFGWDPKRDDPDTTDISSLTRVVKITRLHKE